MRDDQQRIRLRRALALGLLLLTGACHGGDYDKAQQAARDARDIAAVNAANNVKPPPQPLAPQPILYPDIEQGQLHGTGCAFVADGGGMGAVAMTQDKRAAIKLKDVLVILASDPGSTRMPEHSWSRYVGKQYALTLTRVDSGGGKAGSDAQFPGQLVITDPYDQVVYQAKGLVQCRAV
ncbi:hypothetical protein [Novosphingobium lentum]|uniref:hypothetical protein n=1 Tax=Novosphingobium lentum TaxID=145287 RepID=UPI000ABBC3E0|nr:hypothetical protein [Novosphingobium lentum]